MRKFIVARIHYSGLFSAFFKENILNDLLELQNSHGFIKSDGYHWSISEVVQADIDGCSVIRGIMTKIIPTQEYTVIDEETKRESAAEAVDVKDRESHFFIATTMNLIAIETSGMLTKKQLANVFIAGFLKISKAYQPELDYTYNDHLIMEKLEKFSAAKFAKFKLTATNPHANDEFKPLDDQFHEANVSKAEVTYRPSESGKLDIKNENSIVRQSLMMAAAGYGSGLIKGSDLNDRPYTLQLGDNLIDTIEVNESLSDDEVKKQIIIKFREKDGGHA